MFLGFVLVRLARLLFLTLLEGQRHADHQLPGQQILQDHGRLLLELANDGRFLAAGFD